MLVSVQEYNKQYEKSTAAPLALPLPRAPQINNIIPNIQNNINVNVNQMGYGHSRGMSAPTSLGSMSSGMVTPCDTPNSLSPVTPAHTYHQFSNMKIEIGYCDVDRQQNNQMQNNQMQNTQMQGSQMQNSHHPQELSRLDTCVADFVDTPLLDTPYLAHQQSINSGRFSAPVDNHNQYYLDSTLLFHDGFSQDWQRQHSQHTHSHSQTQQPMRYAPLRRQSDTYIYRDSMDVYPVLKTEQFLSSNRNVNANAEWTFAQPADFDVTQYNQD